MTSHSTPVVSLEPLVLLSGSHRNCADGHCFMEAVACRHGLPHNDHPPNASDVLGAYGRALNDALDDAGRQRLVPYIDRTAGTAGRPEADEKAAWLTADWMVHVYATTWLRAAGLDDQAAVVAALPVLDRESFKAMRPRLDEIDDALWQRREQAFQQFEAEFKTAFEAALKEHPDADLAARAARAALADLAALADIYGAVYDAVMAEFDKTVMPKLQPTVVALQDASFELLDRMLRLYETEAA